MIPTLWRYLLRGFLKIFLLCNATFIAMLLATRCQEIAKLASMGGSLRIIALFTLYQIPYVLPFAIPISALIASLLLFKKLSASYELTAMRTCGLSLRDLMKPLFMLGLVISMVNFMITSEVAPKCRFLSRDLLYQTALTNPFFLMQKNLKPEDAFFNMKSKRLGKEAKDVIFIVKNQQTQRLSLIRAGSLFVNETDLLGDALSIINYIPAKDEPYDHLMIENQTSMQIPIDALSQILKKKKKPEIFEQSSFRDLIFLKKKFADTKRIAKSHYEILRRLFFLINPFCLIVLGLSFGIEISRTPSKKPLIWTLLGAIIIYASYLNAKSFEAKPLFATIAFFLPSACVLIFSWSKQRRLLRGVE